MRTYQRDRLDTETAGERTAKLQQTISSQMERIGAERREVRLEHNRG